MTLVKSDRTGATRHIAVLHATHGTIPFTPDLTLATRTANSSPRSTRTATPRGRHAHHSASPLPHPSPHPAASTSRATPPRPRRPAARLGAETAGYAITLTQPTSPVSTRINPPHLRAVHIPPRRRLIITIRALRTGHHARLGHPATKTVKGHPVSARHIVEADLQLPAEPALRPLHGPPRHRGRRVHPRHRRHGDHPRGRAPQPRRHRPRRPVVHLDGLRHRLGPPSHDRLRAASLDTRALPPRSTLSTPLVAAYRFLGRQLVPPPASPGLRAHRHRPRREDRHRDRGHVPRRDPRRPPTA